MDKEKIGGLTGIATPNTRGTSNWQTMSEIWELLPKSCEGLGETVIADILSAINKAYHNGRASTGAERIDSNAVYINGVGTIEWGVVGRKSHIEYTVTGIPNVNSVTKGEWITDEEGELVIKLAPAGEFDLSKVPQAEDDRSPVRALAEKTGRSTQAIYLLIKKYGRMPTEKEVLSQKTGRPRKHTEESRK